MVRFTAKDIKAQHDPRRFHILPPPQLAGTEDGSEDALRQAYAHIDAVQRKRCEPGRTLLAVQRLTVLGVANDINYVVRGLAVAMRDSRQLLLLPPARTPEGRNAKWSGDRTSLVAGRTIERAWHWLDGLPGSSHRSIFWPSACQELFEDTDRARLGAFNELARNVSTAAAAERVGLGGKVFDTALALRSLARGISLSDVPAPFRAYGVLWWWQALTTYLVRVRGPLADRVRGHPALAALLGRLEPSEAARATTTRGRHSFDGARAQLEWLRASRHALARGTGSAESELGWVPAAAFDAGLHVRMGDACGPKARRHQAQVRKCVPSLRAGLAPLLAHGVLGGRGHGGRLFLATDSAQIVAEARAAAGSYAFEVHFLELNRSKYDSEAWIELASAASRSQLQILEETLLDLLLLSRARFVAGSMYGNVPRLALQLRPTTPGDGRRLAYVTTDGRDWCTKPTCMANNTPTGRFW